MKIGQRLFLGFSVIVLSIVILGGIAVYYQNEIIRSNTLKEINRTKDHFFSLEERDARILSAALEVFTNNQYFKDVYLEKDREKLYNYGQPLFQTLKNKYGITHFYFILPDGHCFVRLHNKDIYGDLITRYTFCKARDTKNITSGIEFGKTAFALRIVSPYYNGSELIGYVEFGEEIKHFLKSLKDNTDNEFIIFADKEYLDKEEWRTIRQIAGLRDNWDDLEDHVDIASTIEEKVKVFGSFVEADIDRVEKKEIFLRQIRYEGKVFACGGFEIRDTGNRHVGIIWSFIDITNEIAFVQKAKAVTLGMVIILLIMGFGISFFTTRSISEPIEKLTQAIIKIGKGRLDTRIVIESKDEIGYLASSFNNMVEDLQKIIVSRDSLIQEVAERKKAEKRRDELIQELEERRELLERQKQYTEDSRRAINNVAEDLRESTEILEHQKLSLEATNKELDDFTYIVSHDLKEPLRSIDAYSKFVMDDYKDKLGEEGRHYLERVRANAERMKKLIEDLLEISRLKKRSGTIEEVETKELIGEAKMRLEYAIKQKNAEIIVKDNLPKIFCDRIRLTEVFVNLISNAIKFDDKPKPIIEIGYSDKGDMHEFYVKDNGIGIKEEYFNKIFEIFQRLGKKEYAEGTGAGLTIVKKIIHLHRGEIWVESKIGEGTVFYFTIPKGKDAILGKKLIGEILVEKKLITKEEIKKALEEQDRISGMNQGG